MPKFLTIPKVQLILTLLLIAIASFRNTYILVVPVIFCVLFDLVFITSRKINIFIPYAAIVSGLIIGLLSSPNTVWYQLLVTCALAIASKNFLRLKGKHILNPAGTGLLLSGFIFHTHVSWWGVGGKGPIFFLLLLLPLLVSAYRMRRYISILSFLIVYKIFGGQVMDPILIFFSAVMLPEPITSPVEPKRQIMYGILVAAAVILLSLPQINIFLPDILIAGLLVGNLVFNVVRV